MVVSAFVDIAAVTCRSPSSTMFLTAAARHHHLTVVVVVAVLSSVFLRRHCAAVRPTAITMMRKRVTTTEMTMRKTIRTTMINVYDARLLVLLRQ